MRQRKVLIVEDDLHTRKIIANILSRDQILRYYKLEVLSASDGEEGFAAFSEHRPALVITDLLMPNVDGFQLIERIRQDGKGKRVPILVISAVFRGPQVTERVKNDKRVYFHPKPFSPKNLAQMVRSILTGRAARKREVPKLAVSAPPIKRVASARLQRDPLEQSTRPPPKVAAASRSEASRRLRDQSGQLSEAPLAALLLKLHDHRATGSLDLQRGNVQKVIHLAGGCPIFVQSNLRSETLGILLVRRGGLTEEQHRNVLDEAQRTGAKYGQALVKLGLMAEDQVMAELVAQTRFKVEVCLRWQDGSWQYADDPTIAQRVPNCAAEPLSLVFQGLKRGFNVEEAQRRISRLQPLAAALPKLDKRFEDYRSLFVEAHGPELLDAIQRGASLTDLRQDPQVHRLLLQLDVLSQCGLLRWQTPRRRQTPASPEAKERDSLGLEALMSMDAAGASSPATASSDAGSGLAVEATQAVSEIADERTAIAKQLIEATYLGLHDKTHYEILGIIKETDRTGIEVAYQIKRKQFDLASYQNLNLGPTHSHLSEIIARLDQAFEVLSNAASRSAYDQELLAVQRASKSRALEAEQLFRHGLSLLQQAHYTQAADAFTRAADLDEQGEYVVHRVLALYMSSGRSEEAATEALVRVSAVAQADPGLVSAHIISAQISQDQGQADAAVDHYQVALNVDPTRQDAFIALQRLLLETGRMQELERQYRLTIHLLAARDLAWSAVLWKGLVRLYRDRLNDPGRARMACEAALRLSPDDAELAELLASTPPSATS